MVFGFEELYRRNRRLFSNFSGIKQRIGFLTDQKSFLAYFKVGFLPLRAFLMFYISNNVKNLYRHIIITN